jgi:hypothetical protein
VKQQEKRQTSEGGNSKNQNIANSAWKFLFVQIGVYKSWR